MARKPEQGGPRLVGGRVEDLGEFPDEQAAYRNMTPTERIAAMRRLSRRVYEMRNAGRDVERGHPRLPDRLIGGRR